MSPQSKWSQQAEDLIRDQRERWETGRPRLVHEYLAEHPWLRGESKLLVELIRAEWIRQRATGAVDSSDYLRRFPELESELASALAFPAATCSLTNTPADAAAELQFSIADTHSLLAHDPATTLPHAPVKNTQAQPMAKLFDGSGARFEVLRSHAKGGLGEVFVASDREFNREVALKQIQPKLMDQAEARARFVLEAEITGLLEHPGIVPVYSMGVYPSGSPFYAMRFIRGESLRQAIEKFHARQFAAESERSIEFRKLLGRFVSVCHAIAYAHSRGVLHRDLKPDNIMLGDYGETLVVDWGLASVQTSRNGTPGPSASQSGTTHNETSSAVERPLHPRMRQNVAASQPGQIIGTPAYMPPEQAAGKVAELAHEADIYSLGATLFTLLTGEHAVVGRDKQELLERVRAGQLRRPSELQTAIPKPLEAICLKAMSLKPAERYRSASALAEEVERWLADEPVHAYPEPLRARVRRWVRKHPGPVAAVAVAVVLGMLSAGTFAFLQNRHAQELANKNVTITTQNSELLAQNNTIEKQKSELELTNINLVKAREEAVQERDQAQSVTDFLVRSFRKADPEQDGLRLTVYEVLVRAANEIKQHQQINPLQKAQLLHAIGESFLGLGLYDESAAVTERAVAIRKEHLGSDHRDTVDSMNELALAYRSGGKLDVALPLLEEILRVTRLQFPPEHPNTLASLNNLATVYQSVGKLDLALPLLEETLQLLKAELGPGDMGTLAVTNNLALAYQAAGQAERAIPLFEETLKQIKLKFPEDHPNTLLCMNNLAFGYEAVGQLDLAISLYQETVKRREAKLTKSHPDTLTSMHNLANAYHTAGKYDLALPLFEETLQLAKAALAKDHPDTLGTMNGLARCYRSVGRFDEALALFEETLQLRKIKLSDDHAATLTSMHDLAACYLATSKSAEALALFEETLRRRQTKLGIGHPDTRATLIELTGALLQDQQIDKALRMSDEFLDQLRQNAKPHDRPLAQTLTAVAERLLSAKQIERAESHLRESLALRQSQTPVSWTDFHAQSLLGGCLLEQKKFADAEPLLLAGYLGMKQRADQIASPQQRHVIVAIERLVDLYLSLDKPAEITKWQRELEAAQDKGVSQPLPDKTTCTRSSPCTAGRSLQGGNKWPPACTLRL